MLRRAINTQKSISHKLCFSSSSNVKIIDLRSDVLTKPTLKIKQAMANEMAYNDDIFNECETTKALECKMAKEFKKQSGAFVVSGTMGNLASVLVHCKERGTEVILGDKSHVCLFEQGGISILGGVHSRQLRNEPDGSFDLSDIHNVIRPLDDPHQPHTKLMVLENTHNMCAGAVLPMEFVKKVKDICVESRLKLHLDGARVYNAAVASNKSVGDICEHYDTVSVCLSKGVGAPVGTVVVGDDEFIYNIKRLRKALGGGWRKPGHLAAAGLAALDDVYDRLSNDHKNAKRIGKAFEKLSTENNNDKNNLFQVLPIHSNIVLLKILKKDLDANRLSNYLFEVRNGYRIVAKASRFSKNVLRMCLYSSVNEDMMGVILDRIKMMFHDFS